MKQCRDCRGDKPLSDFPPSKKNRDGAGSYCRPCTRARQRLYRDRARSEPPSRRTGPVVAGSKWCPRCAEVKPCAEFGRNRSTAGGLTAYCRPCHNAKSQESRERNGGARNYHLQRRYGLSVEQVDDLIAAQGGVCALCRTRAPQHVDHDHVTGAVRGVLCSGCNQGLGNLRDDAALLRRAIDYLETTTWQRTQVCTGAYRLTSPRRGAPRSPSSSGLQHLISSRRAGSSRPG